MESSEISLVRGVGASGSKAQGATGEAATSTAQAYLRERLAEEYAAYFGMPPQRFFEKTVNAWMDDENNSRHRFDTIKEFLPEARRVLDMACGCGSAVFFGLKHGYDMHGIDPEEWKHTFNALKANEYGYPEAWLERFHKGVGESLPYGDDYFDCTTTYQTLEHVRDVELSLSEMLRVTRAGGGLHIRCPDYRSTFEGHYRLPWLPLFPRRMAAAYLRWCGRPVTGLSTINYTTRRSVMAALRRIERQHPSWALTIVDVERSELQRGLARLLGSWSSALVPVALPLTRVIRYVRRLFNSEVNVNFFVHVVRK
jgi:ubiquinone/menaquinone biosynthesis C-methylase UbiE